MALAIGNGKCEIGEITDLFLFSSDIETQTFLFYFTTDNDLRMDQKLKSALHLSCTCLVLHVYSAKWLTIFRIETKA